MAQAYKYLAHALTLDPKGGLNSGLIEAQNSLKILFLNSSKMLGQQLRLFGCNL